MNLSDAHNNIDTTTGSVISKFIKRFREAPPASKSDRKEVLPKESFWWLKESDASGGDDRTNSTSPVQAVTILEPTLSDTDGNPRSALKDESRTNNNNTHVDSLRLSDISALSVPSNFLSESLGSTSLFDLDAEFEETYQRIVKQLEGCERMKMSSCFQKETTNTNSSDDTAAPTVTVAAPTNATAITDQHITEQPVGIQHIEKHRVLSNSADSVSTNKSVCVTDLPAESAAVYGAQEALRPTAAQMELMAALQPGDDDRQEDELAPRGRVHSVHITTGHSDAQVDVTADSSSFSNEEEEQLTAPTVDGGTRGSVTTDAPRNHHRQTPAAHRDDARVAPPSAAALDAELSRHGHRAVDRSADSFTFYLSEDEEVEEQEEHAVDAVVKQQQQQHSVSLVVSEPGAPTPGLATEQGAATSPPAAEPPAVAASVAPTVHPAVHKATAGVTLAAVQRRLDWLLGPPPEHMAVTAEWVDRCLVGSSSGGGEALRGRWGELAEMRRHATSHCAVVR